MKIFIGYDSREPLAFHVLAHSILRRTDAPLQIIPLVLPALRAQGVYTRDRGPTESTEFSLTRFLVPYLSHYEGYSLFMDCDMLCLTDIERVFDLAISQDVPVSVVKHDYVPSTETKFLGQVQTRYPMKNWSSLMVFNNRWCKTLDPAFVRDASPATLHRFGWVDGEVGKLPAIYNWLVGEYPRNDAAKILHYTLGGPWFGETFNCDHSREWLEERDHMLRCG